MASSKVLNIEVGKRIVKVCYTMNKGKAFQVIDSFVFGTPDGAVVDGQVVNPAVLGEAIGDQLHLHNLSSIKDCVFAIASSKIAVRDVTVPSIREDQIKSIIATNASDYFPVDISKYTVAHTVISKHKDKDGEEANVLVCAVPTTIIDGYLSLGEAAGLTINAIDFSGNSQYQVLKGIGGEGVTMFVTVDADSSSVSFIDGTRLLLQRSINAGGDDMICRYMGNEGKPDDAYLEAMSELSVSRDKPELDFDTTELEEYLGRFINGVTRSVDFFQSSEYAGLPIERVVLMGSCSHIFGIKEHVSANVGVDGFWLEELENIQGLANSVGDISVFISCLGSRIAPMNLLPKEYLVKTGQVGSKALLGDQNMGRIALGALTGIAVILVAFAWFTNNKANKELAEIKDDIADLAYAEQIYNQNNVYNQGKIQIQSFVDAAKGNNDNLNALIEELEEKMPSNIVFLSLTCTEEGVTMNVTVPDYDEAAITIRQLRSFESFDVITVSGLSKSEDEGTSTVSFSLNCTYPVPETTTVPATEAETSAEE